ncbi:Lacal_2735 family protein [Tamlana sp. 2_MG-2023]|uniref:Lacal_2735 family protein n=1 Tax=unclassified Tamlana TaxID=2614803 RepID=UPI0026E2D600|nr:MULTISPECIES: Lacal_2735 family protein [unclassified Tamlana]MDO6759021.1 Lacal_2735 family protein [Tamlana sp. 2_MG-2023]MDO6789720.1 Lacal_2735 family protein [Tamlana sp. 1_MG-2023]
MNTTYIKKQQNRLIKKYKLLMEQAYNLSQIDASLSDILEFKAIKLLNEANNLNYLSTNQLRYCRI